MDIRDNGFHGKQSHFESINVDLACAFSIKFVKKYIFHPKWSNHEIRVSK